MLDDEREASVFVNRGLVEPDTIIDEERIDAMRSVKMLSTKSISGSQTSSTRTR
jgi:cell division control protein 6